MLRLINCKHQWEKISETFIESNVERLVKGRDDITRVNFRYFSDDLSATNIIILKCSKCGKLNKTITKT